jgi:hypothetical protein
MLSEHSSNRLGFPIRKGGKNADLIGNESLWTYTVLLIVNINVIEYKHDF